MWWMIQFQFYMSCFIMLYKFISHININSTYNYHKLFHCCCILRNFYPSCILDVLWVFLFLHILTPLYYIYH